MADETTTAATPSAPPAPPAAAAPPVHPRIARYVDNDGNVNSALVVGHDWTVVDGARVTNPERSRVELVNEWGERNFVVVETARLEEPR